MIQTFFLCCFHHHVDLFIYCCSNIIFHMYCSIYYWWFVTTCYNFSLNHSIGGVDHLIDFESNHLHSASFFDPITSPDLHTSPRGLVAWFIMPLKLVLLLHFAAPAFRLSSPRLTFVDLPFFSRFLETNKRKRKTGIWSLDPWSDKLLRSARPCHFLNDSNLSVNFQCFHLFSQKTFSEKRDIFWLIFSRADGARGW